MDSARMEVDSARMEVGNITPEEALSKENLRKFHASTGQVDSASSVEVEQLEENVKKFASCPWRMTLHNQTAC